MIKTFVVVVADVINMSGDEIGTGDRGIPKFAKAPESHH